ncbi:MAG: hypothetical protein ACRDWT_12400 [Jatrophihabitantaceae bacterium]
MGAPEASRWRALGSVLVLAGLTLVALIAWLASALTALVTGGLVVLLAVCYQWRARVRARVRIRRRELEDSRVS